MFPSGSPDRGWTVDWRVVLGGQDLTAGWRKVLQSISINDKAGEASDSCDLVISDTDGQIRLPSRRTPISVSLNGAQAFEGFVEKVQSAGSRSGGRTLNVTAKGYDSGGKAKEPQSFHLDDADLGSFLDRMAKNAGLSIKVDPELASYAQDYWSADGESLIALGQRLAQKFGGTFKIRGDRAVLALRGGAALGVTNAVFGKNLISWSITPREPRRQFSGGQARWFDRASASIRTRDLDFDNEDVSAFNIVRPMLGDEGEAEAVLGGRRRESAWEGGEGSVTLDLEPGAVVEGQCNVQGARPGIDGLYIIASVKHSANRTGGATTVLELKQPGSDAGRDRRKRGEPAGGGFALPRHDTLG